MKVLPISAAPVGDTAVLPVKEPLWVPCPAVHSGRGSDGPCEVLSVAFTVPHAGRVALSVPCPDCVCDGFVNGPAQCWCHNGGMECPTCHWEGRLIWGTAEVEFVPVVERPIGGTFQPGQWAAVLTDIKPTTERCPACWGEGQFYEDSMKVIGVPGGMYPVAPCTTCGTARSAGSGTCPPIPHDGGEDWQP